MLRDMRGHGNMIMLRFASSNMERCVCKDLRRKAAQSKLAVVFACAGAGPALYYQQICFYGSSHDAA